jgi:hypothetical protein
MVNGKTFRHALDKFFKSPVCQDARVQVELPNKELYDIVGVDLLENNLLGDNQTHRLVLRCQKPIWKMGKIIGKL